MDRAPLGHFLKQQRRAARLTQKRLAMQMGYHSSRISRMESGEEIPSAEYIERFCAALDLSNTQARVLRSLYAQVAHSASPLPEPGDLPQAPAPVVPAHWFVLPAREPLPVHSYYPLPEHQAVVTKLVAWLTDPQERPIVCLSGAGGVGKTTLALETAVRLGRERTFVDVLYVGARYLQSPSESDPLTRRLNFEMVLDRLAGQMRLAEAPNQATAEKKHLLAAFFRASPYLILLDNLEDSDNESAIVRQLVELLNPSRLLITTRSRALDGLDFVRPLHLRGLGEQDSAKYVRAEAARLDNSYLSELEQKYLDEIHALTFGVPFALKRVIGQAQTWSLETALENLRRAVGPEDQEFYNYLFEKDWRALDWQAQRVWLLLGRMIPAAISLAQLRELDEAGTNFVQALDKLVSRNLIETNPGLTDETKRYELHPLARLFLEHLPKLVRLSAGLADFYRVGRVRTGARLWLKLGARDAKIVRFDAERENILHAARECFAWNESQTVLDLWETFSTPLYDMGYWIEYTQLDTLALNAARQLKNARVEAQVQSELGWVAMQRGDYAQAKAFVRGALAIFTVLDDPLWVFIARRYLATIHMAQNDLIRARDGFMELLRELQENLSQNPTIPEAAIRRQTAVIHDSLGSILRELGDFETAEKELLLGYDEARARNAAAKAISLLNLGKLKLKQEHLPEARHFLQECLTICREQNLRGIAAGALHHLAEVSWHQGDREGARRMALDSARIYRLLGAASSEKKVTEFLATIS